MGDRDRRLPILFAAGVWRQAVRRVPLRYDAQYWPVVFSSVGYALGTFLLAGASHATALEGVATVFVAFAASVWVVLMIGLWRLFLPRAGSSVAARV